MDKIQSFLDFLARKQKKSKFRYNKSKDAENKTKEDLQEIHPSALIMTIQHTSLPDPFLQSENFWKRLLLATPASVDIPRVGPPKKKYKDPLHQPTAQKLIPSHIGQSIQSTVGRMKEEIVPFPKEEEKDFDLLTLKKKPKINRPRTQRPSHLSSKRTRPASSEPELEHNPTKKSKLNNREKALMRSSIPSMNNAIPEEFAFGFASEKVIKIFLLIIKPLKFISHLIWEKKKT